MLILGLRRAVKVRVQIPEEAKAEDCRNNDSSESSNVNSPPSNGVETWVHTQYLPNYLHID